MKIVFFNRFFFPDTSATSQIVSDLAFHLAGEGHEVHVVTSRVAGGELVQEAIRGVSIHRVATANTQPHGLVRRALAYVDYYRGARRAARDLLADGDVVVLKTDPPLLSAALGHLAKARGARVVVWLQDLFPEVAREYGVPGMGGMSGALLQRIRDRSLAIADRIVVIGERMARKVESFGLPRERVHVIHNWADGKAVIPVEHDANPLRRDWKLAGIFVVGYSGNLGRVHEFETLLDAAAILHGDPGIRFVVIGRGPRRQEVEARVARDGLTNVRFEPHQERESLSQSLGVADVHISVLRPEFESLVHPSKLYGIMAAGRPTLFVGDPEGETAAILSATGSGQSIRTGDAAGLAQAIRSLRDDAAAWARMGTAARRAFEAAYDMPVALGKWRELLATLARKDS